MSNESRRALGAAPILAPSNPWPTRWNRGSARPCVRRGEGLSRRWKDWSGRRGLEPATSSLGNRS